MKLKFNIDQITQQDIDSVHSLNELLSKYNYSANGRTLTKIKENLNSRLNLSNLDKYKRPIKYNKVEISCPVCTKTFTTLENHPRSKTTCSYSCSNTYFRSGQNHPNSKSIEELLNDNSDLAYRRLCFSSHIKKCVVCKEDRIVSVHHYDNNHYNNSIENLIPLCPTHHQYMHSKHINLIKPKVDKYREEFMAHLQRIEL